jgi:hypothetical protein
LASQGAAINQRELEASAFGRTAEGALICPRTFLHILRSRIGSGRKLSTAQQFRQLFEVHETRSARRRGAALTRFGLAASGMNTTPQF